ncbi:hypothetical protein [Granulosicoccus antarcticus]|uniref:Uncharacterized protein n=1 Tax=Granulosicoccus antarcticus IMCC3135 TaxID=1192854 RepID=A0A2Z2NLP5_9GAMM|nr:hypothetical protein [Granulosicoccus antarcticus]ASJ72089.1 hypothetical protein IMCC3135_09975 [Granulosicoccus antarcticus IMCC3135]
MSQFITFDSWRLTGLRSQVTSAGTVSFGVKLATDQGADTVSVTLPLAGPGQMVGLHQGAVRKMVPAHGAGDHRAGALAYLELRDPNLPWSFSFTGKPTLGLLCMPDDDEIQFSPTRVPNPVVTIKGGGARLPPIVAFDLMAHVHNGDGAAFARLLCPQELNPNTRYLAALVPLTVKGRIAALGDVPDPNIEGSGGPAWDTGTAALTVPALHWWRFGTGTSRGAEDMLRDLRRIELKANPETLPLSAESTQLLNLPPDTTTRRAPLLVNDLPDFSPLAALLNALSPHDDRGQLRMPLPSYGRLYAKKVNDKVNDAGPDLPDTELQWFAELNRTPSYRIMASLGAEVVRRHQDNIIGFLRDEAGAIDDANALLSRGHLSQRLAAALYAGMAKLSDEALLRFAAPALARIKTVDGSGAKIIRGTAYEAAGHPALRRRVSRGLMGKGSGGTLADAIVNVSQETRKAHDVAGTGGLRGWQRIIRRTDRIYIQDDKRLDPAALISHMRFEGPESLRAQADTIRDGVIDTTIVDVTETQLHPAGPQPLTASISSAAVREIRGALNPAVSIPPRLRARIKGAPEMGRTPLPRRLLHDPVWPEPIVELLFDLDPNALAPGLSDVPADSVVGLILDGAALEAVTVGANHELLRELVWRGLPVTKHPSPVRRAFPVLDTGGPASFDLEPVSMWGGSTPLGTHWGGKVGFMAIIRSEIFFKHPDTLCYLCAAKWSNDRREIDPNRNLSYPVAMGQIGLDMIYLGFEASADNMRGELTSAGSAGQFLVFEVPQDGLSFGLGGRNGAAKRSPAQIKAEGGWQSLDWDDLDANLLTSADFAGIRLDGLEWGASAAAMAGILLERPPMVALHGSDLLGPRS